MSETKTFTISRHFKRTLEIDDGENDSVRLPVFIRRFTQHEYLEFEREWLPLRRPDYLRLIHRRPEGEEQEQVSQPVGKMSVDVYRIGDDEIERRRLEEMGEAGRAAFRQARDAHAAAITAFCHKAIRQHVWLQPGVRVLLDDGAEIQTPEELADLLAGNSDQLAEVVGLIWNENTMSPDAKKRLRSRLASTRGSAQPKARGETPDGTAGAAEPAASAAIDAATADPAPIPSGSPGSGMPM